MWRRNRQRLRPDAPAPPSRRRWLIIAAAVAAVLIVASVVVRSCTSDDGSATTDSGASTTLDPRIQAAIDTAVDQAIGLSVADIFQKIQPSVVEIDVTEATAGTGGGDRGSGLGTGVIVNGDGTILTANHVVAGADTIEVVFADGTRSAATVASADEQQDIATLTPETLPSLIVPATLGGGAKVGDPVVAVGNPLGLDDTTTSGVVSALDRTARADDGIQRSGLIQFDAAVNPGSSGGPLLDAKAEVIGIVTALADPSEDGFFIGIGFAVPIQTAVAAGGGSEPPK